MAEATRAYDPAMPEQVPSSLAETSQIEPAVRTLRRFRLVFNAVKTHFRQVERQAGVGGAQLWALSVVRAAPGIGVGGLARAMDIHQTTASNLVRGLVEQQLLAAERHAPDRRLVSLKLLPAGRQVLRKAPGPFSGVLPDALASLDAATLERLDHDLGLLIAALGVDDSAAQLPLSQM
jgi:MarR family transcriptional regulator, organic hydroperoxide resistance regulator